MRPEVQRLGIGFALALLALAWAPPSLSEARAQDVKVLVAVLPFRVHSAAPLEYLEQSLANLLVARLEASGQVQVVDSVVVRESLVDYAAGELTETAVRRLARELGADYVVAGSLTELAGQYSLDVRVTPVGSDVPSRTMVFTATGDEELLDRVNELSSRVLSIVTGAAAPRAQVVEVRIEGLEDPQAEADAEPAPERPELLTKPGETYDSSAARRDLATLRALPGVATGRLDTERTPEGVIVTFRLVRAERLLGATDELGTEGEDVIAEVRIQGNRRIEANAIRARIVTRRGDVYNPGRLAEDVREVYALGFFRDVRVISEESIDGRILIFEVQENPLVRQVSISGNDNVEGDRIRDALTLTTGSTLDYPLLFENRERIEALYRAEGYYLADVEYEIESLPGDAVAVHFKVDENEKLRLTKIEFIGNEHFDDDELRVGFQTRVWRLWSYVTRFIDRSGTYSEPVFLQDLQSIEQKYRDAGFVRVEVGDPDVRPVDEGLVVSVEIHEGERYKVASVDVAGDETVDLESLREKLLLKEGEYFNHTSLTEDVGQLTDVYTSQGFYTASVTPRTEIDETDLTVDITFDVQKGSLYFLREIDIAGNTATVDPVIRREMRMVEGELYSARAVRMSQNRVRGLGFFDEVNFEPKQTDRPGELDLDVQVIERPTGSLSFGAGFSSQESFVIAGGVSQSNLFGRGYGLQLSVDLSEDNQRFFLSLTDPYFLGSTFSFASTIFSTDLEFEDFIQEQQGIDLTLGHPLDEENRTRVFGRYSWASREIFQDTGVNAASMIFREILGGEESISLFSVGFRHDSRDDRIAPTKGWLTGGLFEFAGLGGFSKFARLEGRVTYFTRPPGWVPGWFPFRETGVFVLAARAGWAIPFNSIDDWNLPSAGDPGEGREQRPLDKIDTELELPLSERYFLGGLGTFQLRGFKARSVGPRRAILRRSGFIGRGSLFRPVGILPESTDAGSGGLLLDVCADDDRNIGNQGDGDGRCNSLYDREIDDFDDLDETDVIGGNKFISLTAEYRFPISESLGLVGIVFLDVGNAFDEEQDLFDVGNWRYGTGFGAQWFSPFGPLQAFVGFPLDKLEVEDGVVFEFSMGGAQF